MAFIATVFFSCSTDDALREAQCNCDITVIRYENSSSESTIMEQNTTSLQSDCSNDGNYSEEFNENNQLITTTWDCTSL